MTSFSCSVSHGRPARARTSAGHRWTAALVSAVCQLLGARVLLSGREASDSEGAPGSSSAAPALSFAPVRKPRMERMSRL